MSDSMTRPEMRGDRGACGKRRGARCSRGSPLAWFASLVVAASIASGWPSVAAAQLIPGMPGTVRDTAADSTRDTVDVSPESPREAVARYLELAREGRFEDAARFLEVPDSLRDEAPRLARQLKAVLDRHLWVDLEQVSALAQGDTADGLPPGLDQLGRIQGSDGILRPVRMTRAPVESDVPWRFSVQTVARVPAWYEALDNRWMIERIPEPLQRPGPFDILWWQWIALPALAGVSWMIGALAGQLLRGIASRIASRTRATWDDALLVQLRAPIATALTLAAFAALLPLLGLNQPPAVLLYRVVRAGLYLTFFWSLWRVINVVIGILSTTAWALTTPSSRALLPLGSRVAKAVLIAIGVVAVLSLLGFPVASLLAGLGIGGLALALAAQKTVENLFGAFSIGVDQPFREGDFVRVEDFVGTVEKIGLRSTRFRTLERTVISIPNAKVADSRLESLAARDRLRLFVVVGLVYETTAAQMREVLAGFERILRAHPKVWPDVVVVRFRELAASSLDVEVSAWFMTSDWNEFTLIRQEILLQFMEVVERAGTSIAFPTQTVHIAPASNGTDAKPLAASQPSPSIHR